MRDVRHPFERILAKWGGFDGVDLQENTGAGHEVLARYVERVGVVPHVSRYLGWVERRKWHLSAPLFLKMSPKDPCSSSAHQ